MFSSGVSMCWEFCISPKEFKDSQNQVIGAPREPWEYTKAVAKQLFTNKGVSPTEQNPQANAIIKWCIIRETAFTAEEFTVETFIYCADNGCLKREETVSRDFYEWWKKVGCVLVWNDDQIMISFHHQPAINLHVCSAPVTTGSCRNPSQLVLGTCLSCWEKHPLGAPDPKVLQDQILYDLAIYILTNVNSFLVRHLRVYPSVVLALGRGDYLRVRKEALGYPWCF